MTQPGENGRGRAALTDGMLVFTRSGGQVTAVSPHTGELLWRTRTSLERPGEPGYDAVTGTVYLASDTGRVAALDRLKGTLLWETLPRATPTWSVQGAPGRCPTRERWSWPSPTARSSPSTPPTPTGSPYRGERASG